MIELEKRNPMFPYPRHDQHQLFITPHLTSPHLTPPSLALIFLIKTRKGASSLQTEPNDQTLIFFKKKQDFCSKFAFKMHELLENCSTLFPPNIQKNIFRFRSIIRRKPQTFFSLLLHLQPVFLLI